MSIDPNLAPLTETVTIERGFMSTTAYAWNGPHRVAIALHSPGTGGPVLCRDGVPLRETLPGVDGRDVLDLLAAGKCGDFAVEVRTVRPAARRDVEFGGSF